MDWKKAEVTSDGVKVPATWLMLHYYEALNVLFRVENALRMFVYIVLKETKRGKWVDVQITSDDGGETTIGAVAKRRLAQDERFGYLGYRIASPLMHLTSGELTRIILADAYWSDFASYFPASKEIVRTKLEEIGNIRNALAHFRPIKSDDVEVVKQNANQVMARVDEALANVLRAFAPVPSNTADDWYSSLKSVAGQYCTLGFRQSENESWIQARLVYACPHVGKPYVAPTYKQWSVLTLKSANILRHSPALLEHVIFVSESFPYLDGSSEQPPFKKFIELTFSRNTLHDAHVALKADLDEVVALITKESDLVLEDNLARGELVQLARVTAGKYDNSWLVNDARLKSPLRHDDPAEYWGEKPSMVNSFVTDTPSYPWMPVEVSAEEVPF